MRTYIHTYIHVCVHTYIRTYIHTYILTHTSKSHIRTSTHACIHTCMHACMHTYVYKCMHISACTYICVHLHTYTYRYVLTAEEESRSPALLHSGKIYRLHTATTLRAFHYQLSTVTSLPGSGFDGKGLGVKGSFSPQTRFTEAPKPRLTRNPQAFNLTTPCPQPQQDAQDLCSAANKISIDSRKAFQPPEPRPKFD